MWSMIILLGLIVGIFVVSKLLLKQRRATQVKPQLQAVQKEVVHKLNIPDVVVLRILTAAENPYSGYELLQTILATGLRFGDMNIFHYYEDNDENSPVLFSLASLTEPGCFDLENMGGYSCDGLTLFMQFRQQKSFVAAFDAMLLVAQQLVNDLGGKIVDKSGALLDEDIMSRLRAKIRHYENRIHNYDLF